ncbi:ABC-2 transporter permease [Paludisphaera rhizosphaerae]|uniref:hypothetical protein n=1 Tax=Paludisphaera rhizosphaerae TaxID=2711216 RepID=UPI0013E9D4D8|nr:hypothetical protein [Paludisphaera rhizosphaerae]
MMIAPFIKREFAASVERASLFRDRLAAAALAGAAVVGCLGLWDWMGWDRLSVSGAARFAHTAFAVVAFVQMCVAFGFTSSLAAAIASERDRKSLDSLLATRFTSLEVVVGVMAAHLLRTANATLATFPVVVLLVYFGGVDPRLAWLSMLAAASTALGVAGLCLVASVESRTTVRATFAAGWWIYVWYALPMTFLIIRPLVLPPLPPWMTAPLLWALDGSPFGLATSLLGAFPRPWGFAEGVFRMAAIQVVLAVAATAWATYRLRPASRELNDAEGRAGALKSLRAANRWTPPRRPCGDDPIFWSEQFARGPRGRAQHLSNRLMQWLGTTVCAVGVWWFAGPAFAELLSRGYGPSTEAYYIPEENPLTRVIAERLVVGTISPPGPGRARLEFNLAIRQFTSLLVLAFSVGLVGAAAESINRERLRDTWLGLLATPLTGREIVRGKSRGALWRTREAVYWLMTLWLLGLASGAIHPLGFLAGLVWLGISYPLYSSLGVTAGLNAEKAKWPLDPAGWPRALAAIAGVTLLTSVIPPILAMAPLFTWEEVAAVTQGGAVPWLKRTPLAPWVGSRSVAVAWLVATAAIAACTVAFHASLTGSFDAVVGRPHRSGKGDDTPNSCADRIPVHAKIPAGLPSAMIWTGEVLADDSDSASLVSDCDGPHAGDGGRLRVDRRA